LPLGDLLRGVREIRDRHCFYDEFKISRGKLPIFCELVDLLEQSDAHIAACVVDRTIGDNPFTNGTPQWLAHAKITAKLLVGIINRRELVSLLIDEIPTPRGCALRKGGQPARAS
jgi:hypothetical protein